MALEDIAKPIARGTLPDEDNKPQVATLKDTLMAVPRGIEGFGQSLYDLFDYASGDALPNYDKRLLGRSETMVGGFVEGATQFLTGFIPVAGQLGKLQKANKALNTFRKARPVTSKVLTAASAGAVSDFISFQAQEERLSNFLNEFPDLANPVSEYLAADKDDGEIEGRFKNVVEGLFLEAGMVGIGTAFTQSVKAIKKAKKGTLSAEDLETITTFNSKASADEAARDFNYGTPELRSFAEGKYGADYQDKDLNLLQVLSDYGTHSPQTPEGELAQTLVDNFQDILGSQTIKFSSDQKGKTSYNTRVNFEEKIFNGSIEMGIGGERALLHEATHAITQIGIHKQLGVSTNMSGKEYHKALDAFMASDSSDGQAVALKGIIGSYQKTIASLGLGKEVQKASKGTSALIKGYDYEKLPYGLANLSEFMSEAMTNSEFQRTLRDIEGSGKQGSSIFDDVKDFVKQLLGIGGKQASLLDDVFEQVADLGTANNKMVHNLLDLESAAGKLKGEKTSKLGASEEGRMEQAEGKKQNLSRGLFEDFEASGNNFDDALGDTLDLKEGYKDRPFVGNVDGFQGRGFVGEDYPLQGAGIDSSGTQFSRYPRPAPVQWSYKDSYEGLDIDEIPNNRLEAYLNGNAKDVEGNVITINQRETKAIQSELKIRELEVNGDGRNVGRVNAPEGQIDDIKMTERDALLADKDKTSFRPEGLVYTNGVVNARKLEAEGKGIAAVTKSGTHKHYGTPFSHLASFKGKDIVKTKNLKESNDNYTKWLEGTDFKDVAQDQRKWTLEQIDSGALDDVDLIYYSRQRSNKVTEFENRVDKDTGQLKGVKLPQNNHAAILRNFINERRGVSKKSTKQQTKFNIVTEKAKSIIYAQTDLLFTKQNADDVIKEINSGTLKKNDPILKGLDKDKAANLVDWAKNLAFKAGVETDIPSKTARYIGMSKNASNNFRAIQERLKQKESGKIDALDVDRRSKSMRSRLDEDQVSFLGTSEEGRIDPKNDIETETDLNTVLKQLVEGVADELETGGTAALMSSSKNITSSQEATLLIQALAHNLNKSGKKTKVTKAKLIEEVKGIIQQTASGDEIDFKNTIDKLSDTDLTNYRGQVQATKQLLDVLSRQSVDLAKKNASARTDTSLNKPRLRAELLSTLDKLNEVTRIWSLQGKEAGLTLVQRRFLKGAEGFRKNQKVGFDFENIKDSDAMEAFADSKLGSMKFDDIVDALTMAQDAGDVKGLIQTGKITKGMRGGSMMRMINEYWINSLLSGPTTQAVNALGNTITAVMSQAEIGMGALIDGNPLMAKAVVQYAFQVDTFSESLSIGARSFRENDAILTQGSGVFSDMTKQTQLGSISSISAENVNRILPKGVSVGTTLGDGINTVGSIIRLPSQFLQAGDEYFKQFNYRAYVKTQLAYQAMTELKLRDGKEIAEYVTRKFDDYITQGGRAYNEENLYLDALDAANKLGVGYGLDQKAVIKANMKKFDPSRGSLANAALDFAKKTTFTNELDGDSVLDTISRGLSKFKEKVPLFNFIVPFVRTPTNILKFALGRTGFGAVGELAFNNKKFMEQYNSKDPRVRAAFKGRLAVAASSTAAFFTYFASNQELITGYGPQDKAKNEAWQAGGKRPYSIKIGDKWVSYQRLDPVATIMGLVADISHAEDYNVFDEGELEQVLATISLAFVQNITNKSYVKGLDSLVQAFRDPVANIGKIGNNVAGGFVPTLLAQSMTMGDERILKESRGMLDAILKKIPIVEANVPNKRNFLGESMTIENYFGPANIINPFGIQQESDDIVDQEISRLQHGFSKVTPKLHGAIDLREVNENDRQAYDRLLEIQSESKINNLSQRQALRKLMKSKFYQNLPEESDSDIGMKSPRVNAINKILKRYRKFSRNQLLKEFPELNAQYEQMTQDRLQYRTTL